MCISAGPQSGAPPPRPPQPWVLGLFAIPPGTAPAFSGYPGGKLAYHFGIRVAGEITQAEGYAAGRRAA